MTLDEIIALPQYSLSQPEKEQLLLEQLLTLDLHHIANCPEYGIITERLRRGQRPPTSLASFPYLPVRLFKSHLLKSIADADVFRTMVSSGTTGDAASQIVLDRATAERQARALVSIMTVVLGRSRLPMMVVDTNAIISSRGALTARGAGALGMMNFGRRPVFVLDDAMRLDVDLVRSFVDEHGDQPFLVFGFTFMIWQYLLLPLEAAGVDMSNAVVIHSGGWKKLTEQAVDNPAFKRRLNGALGIRRVYNFYGMVEQVGSVFLEGDDGALHTPNFADIIVRDPETWEEAPVGVPGVLQVLSALPTSYPGHSILTEDIGVVHSVDGPETARPGKSFSVIGRVPKAELRGCSDTHAYDRR